MKKCGVALVSAALLFAAGCGIGLKESLRGIAGTSTKILEEERPGAISKEFALDYDSAYAKAKKTLEDVKAYIYAEDRSKGLIAVYFSEENTTPVGVFLKSVDKSRTEISVSSPSSSAKELMSVKLFAGLEK